MDLLCARNSVVEISRICLTLRGRLLNLPLEMSRNWFGGTAGFLVAAVLAGCGANPFREEPPEVIVKQRAQERWNALVAGDLTKAYSYMSPASRQAISPELFRNSIRLGFWKSAEVGAVTCDKDACEAVVQMTYTYRGTKVSTPFRETWVHSDGNWWHVFKPT